MSKLINDVATLTTISDKTLERLISIAEVCINDAVEEALLLEKDSVDVDIGIGIVYIQFVGNKLSFKFVPSEKLETSLKNTIINKKNLLEYTLETSLVNKLTKTYKDLI